MKSARSLFLLFCCVLWPGISSGSQDDPLGIPGKIILGNYAGGQTIDESMQNQGTSAELETLDEITDRHMSIVNLEVFWNWQYWPNQALKDIKLYDAVPMFNFKPWPDWGVNDPDYSLDAIIQGQQDEYLGHVADWCISYDKPIFISFAVEMNGDWFPWSGVQNGGAATTGFGDSAKADGPERYIAAYRHVVDIFKSRGATNVIWVFQPNAYEYPEDASWNQADQYYPGDDYVDWIGVSVYGQQYAGDDDPPFRQGMDDAYERLTAIAPSKPLMVAEWGRAEIGAANSKSQWIANALTDLAAGRWPYVRAILYWDEVWTNEDNSISDLRINSSVSSRNAYRQGISDTDVFIDHWHPTLQVSPNYPSNTRRQQLASSRFWAYQIDQMDVGNNFQLILDSYYDLVVIDQIRSLKGDENYNSENEVLQLHTAGKQVLAYVSIGEAEIYRYYWNDTWVVGNPEWIEKADPDGWDGAYVVRYWHPEWRQILFGQATAYLDRVIEDGFDGIYMDWVEAPFDPDIVAAAEAEGKNPEIEMVNLIRELSDYAHSKNPNFLIVAQNATELSQYDHHVQTLDAITQEHVWFDGSSDENGPQGDVPSCCTEEYLQNLQIFQSSGVPVFTVDYALQNDNADFVYQEATNRGFHAYVTTRELDQLTSTPPPGYGSASSQYSLRFYGNGINAPDQDRVKISLDPQKPVDVGMDFTVEFWMKANPQDNGAGNCVSGNDGWMNGNIIINRDIFGGGDYGDFGVSLFANGIAFGVHNGSIGTGICGGTNPADGQWHHIALTRNATTGEIQLYVDGTRQAQTTGPTGDLSYRDNRTSSYPNSDPYWVIGAEKHDLLPQSLPFNGWIDEIRISNIERYTSSSFGPSTEPFSSDSNTVALYHLDEGNGSVIGDSSGSNGGPSPGVLNMGGNPAGPVWTTESPFSAPFEWPQLTVSTYASGLESPVHIAHAGDNSGRIFVVERSGKIRIIKNGTLLPIPFLNIETRVQSGNEEGLLSVAFAPQYLTKQYFYVYYTNLSGDIVVSRFFASVNADIASSDSEQIILTVPHPGYSNHNGGQMAFGPDGYLYIGTGDGGGGGDPNNNAQNMNSLLGKLLRIDVESGASPYAIPATNPYVGVSGDDLIWAAGLRNPWRFSFDREDGNLFIGDVGQSSSEEINLQQAATPGGQNYGWRILEGNQCYNPSSNCSTPQNYSAPIQTYDHSLGCSVTGGFVYRGETFERMQAIYFYGDFCSGRIWGLYSDSASWQNNLLNDTNSFISTFGEDESGTIYYADLIAGTIHVLTDTTSTPHVAIYSDPSNQTLAAGQSAIYTLQIARNNYLDPVDLTLGGLPVGASALWSEDPVLNNTSTLTILTDANSTPEGQYILTVNASSPNLSIAPIEIVLNIAILDADGDGLSDTEEETYGTDPNDPDSDDDGMNDLVEIQAGTNPLDSDSDDDEYTDGEESNVGTDPLSVESFPGELLITADNEYILYVNAIQLGVDDNWADREKYLVNADEPLDIAIEATDRGSVAALACQITHGNDHYPSNFTWQVSNTFLNNWMSDSTSHATWVNATEHFAMGQGPWGNMGNEFSPDVFWIWSSDANNHNKVYFWTQYNPGQNGVIKASGDNQIEIYQDNDLLGTGNNWTQVVHVPTIIKPNTVVGLYGMDGGGVGGILGEILYRDSDGSLQSIVTDTSWKYSTAPVSGWADQNFDDTNWPLASGYGLRGSPPWNNSGTVKSVSSLSQWIWSDQPTSDNSVWARKVIPTAVLTVSCDNLCEVYLNGSLIAVMNNWIQPISVGLALNDNDTLGIKATDLGGLGGILASIRYNGLILVTNNSWKVSTTEEPGWNDQNFDDSTWSNAESYGSNGVLPWNNIPGINSHAQWIWSADRYGDNEVYARFDIGDSNAGTGLTRLTLSADNTFQFYFNGERTLTSSQWSQARTAEFEFEPEDILVVDATDTGYKAGFLMSSEGAYNVSSDTSWKMSTSNTSGWEQPGFDDSAWANATSYGAYGVSPWYSNVSGFTDNPASPAYWIWSSNNPTGSSSLDKRVFLRKKL